MRDIINKGLNIWKSGGICSMDKEEAKKCLREMYEDVRDEDFYSIDPTIKDSKLISESALIYGEFPPEKFPLIMHHLNPQEGEVFFDLGSGIGKLLIYLGLTGDFSQVCGIEAVKEYYDIACDKIKVYDKLDRAAVVSCIFDDFLRNDIWTKADIVFAFATCYTETMMTEIARLAVGLDEGARFVSINMPLKATYLKLRLRERFDFGDTARAEVFIYERV